ncbi:hypothetical protein HMPREF1578_01151 [Gardnerella pickettii JCP8017B]|nr:hypothetical protein HMPREF1578_01151 [Gardnerella pickettii JCP8017B]
MLRHNCRYYVTQLRNAIADIWNVDTAVFKLQKIFISIATFRYVALKREAFWQFCG